MTRRPIVRAAQLSAAFAVFTACQNYTFHQVGSCLIQPGINQLTLDDITKNVFGEVNL